MYLRSTSSLLSSSNLLTLKVSRFSKTCNIIKIFHFLCKSACFTSTSCSIPNYWYQLNTCGGFQSTRDLNRMPSTLSATERSASSGCLIFDFFRLSTYLANQTLLSRWEAIEPTRNYLWICPLRQATPHLPFMCSLINKKYQQTIQQRHLKTLPSLQRRHSMQASSIHDSVGLSWGFQ